MKILVTAGAGFIGSAVIRHLIADIDHSVLNVDKLTYTGNLESLADAEQPLNFTTKRGLLEICVDTWKYQVLFKSNCRK